MIPNIMEILGGEETVLKKRGKRRFDVERVGAGEADEARVTGNEAIGSFEVDGKHFGEDSGGGGQGV